MKRENNIFETKIWKTPLLPTLPTEVYGVKKCTVSLADRQEKSWQFFEEEVEEMPSPYAEKQDFDFSSLDEKGWKPVVVPGSLTMQGWDIENNREYYYRRKVTIPEDFAGRQLWLRFEGVYSSSRVWVNGRYLYTHIGGFTPFDCNLSAFSREKEITLVVGVADIEGKEEGIWNPEQEYLGDSSWASFYAHHNLCGILRGVTMYAVDDCFLGRMHLQTVRAGDGAELDTAAAVCVPLGESAEDLSLHLELFDEKGGRKAELRESLKGAEKLEAPEFSGGQPDEEWCRTHAKAHENDLWNSRRFLPTVPNEYETMDVYALTTKIAVPDPVFWDAEHPHLYTLVLSLQKNGKTIQKNEIKTGLRLLDFGGSNGSDRNRLYVNGREIKLRGVCRHDVSWRYGRSMSEEEELQEILAYKRNNVNFIRTSHYPASDHLLSLCDQYGIYVELENAACFKGANGVDIYCPPQDFVNGFAEMVEYSRNHPSVIIWSLGNESGFDETAAFRTEYNYIKEADPGRPVIFSYPFTVDSKPCPYDILSMHYQDVNGALGRADMPKLHDEFAHVPCYNLCDLKTDNQVRCQWGESIRRGWNNIFETDGALGCAIWGGVDDVFLLPENVPARHQCHSDGKAVGYGEWGAILDIYQREKPEAYLTKKAFTPVLLDRRNSSVQVDGLLLSLKNRFDHTDLKELRVRCTNEDGTIFYDGVFPVSVPPHSVAEVKLPLAGEGKRVLLEFYQNALLIESEWIGERTEAVNRKTEVLAPTLEDSFQEIVYRTIRFSMRMRKQDGAVSLYQARTGEELISNWVPYGKGCQETPHRVQVTSHWNSGQPELIAVSSFEDGTSAVLKLIFNGTAVKGDYQCIPSPAARTQMEKSGLAICLCGQAESVSWEKEGLYTVYPEEHIGRLSGTAWAEGPERTPYGEKPEHDWGLDTEDPFLFTDEENCRRNVTRDFQTTRDHIQWYCVQMENGWKFTVLPEGKNCSAMVERNENGDRLLLTKGNRFSSIGWGNDCGEPLGEADFHLSFTLIPEREQK